MAPTNLHPSRVLADIIHYMKYARYLPEQRRRETYEETVNRNMMMHVRRYPHLAGDIAEAYKSVFRKDVLPAMRAFQFSGPPIEKNHCRMYNCSYVNIEHPKVFHEIIFLLLSGCGVGYSVQQRHVSRLPKIKKVEGERFYEIPDSIEGWAYAVDELVSTYFEGKPRPVFIFDKIRPAGSPIVTSGGVAPGPEPLKNALFRVYDIFEGKLPGERLSTLECHDIICHLAQAVLSGGIRRSSSIALFSPGDKEMMECKTGEWWKDNVQRSLANNSVAVLRDELDYDLFNQYWETLKSSGSGEPNIFQTNDLEYGCNPCVTGDTWVQTSCGPRRVLDLLGKQHKVVVHGGFYSTTGDGFFKTGTKNVFLVKTCEGFSLKVTSDHKLSRVDSDGSCSRWVRASELKVGDVLDLHDHRGLTWGGEGTEEMGEFWGRLAGERLSVKGCSGEGEVKVCDGQAEQTFFVKCSDFAQGAPFAEGGVGDVDERIEKTNDSFYKGFLRGIFDVAGSFERTQEGGVLLKLFPMDTSFSVKVQRMLARLGIISTREVSEGCSRSVMSDVVLCECISEGSGVYEGTYDLVISGKNISEFLRRVGFSDPVKNSFLEDMSISDISSSEQKCFAATVENVELLGPEEVFDVQVPEVNCFDANGFVAHNCGEISLEGSGGFCNLVEINSATLRDQKDFNHRARMAARLGTLQASYVDFPLLRDVWRENSLRDGLVGVGMTGIAAGMVLRLNCEEAARGVLEENRRMAALLGISPAKRATTVKPSGTTSLALGNGVPISSGVHGYWDEHYLRRVIVTKTEPLYQYLSAELPWLLEDSAYRPETESVVTIPLKAPDGAITRREGALSLLTRVKHLHRNWIVPGHCEGPNTNNVSVTVPVREEEWDKVQDWWWKNRHSFVSLTFLPDNGGNYKQLPFESCSEETYREMVALINEIDLCKVEEMVDGTVRGQEPSCAGGMCELG